MDPLKIFIGWDSRDRAAYDVLKFSIEKNTFNKIKIIPLNHKELRRQGYFSRPWLVEPQTGDMIDLVDKRKFSTEFSHTRFLVPELCKHQGWAVYMDCDMLVRCNIKELLELKDESKAVMVVKHNHKPKQERKDTGEPQQRYHRKNWSSMVLWNCGHPSNKQASIFTVNTRAGSWLHGFEWLNDLEIGALPSYFNWIEGSTPIEDVPPKIIHFSQGGPWQTGKRDIMFSDEWWRYYKLYNDDMPLPYMDISTINYKELA